MPGGGSGGEEEKNPAFDEGSVVICEGRSRRHLVEPVGDATAVELVLKAPMPFVVIDYHGSAP
jgi:hypothetical protein